MKTVVIYKTKTGYTKQYAKWIAEDLAADIFESKEVNSDMLLKYDTIIYGAGIYAGGINGVKLIKENLDRLKDKKVVVFANGAYPQLEEVFKEILEKNFTLEEREKIKFFHLRGGFDYSELSLINKCLMSGLKFSIKRKKKENLEDYEEGILSLMEKSENFVERKNIKEIIEFAK